MAPRWPFATHRQSRIYRFPKVVLVEEVIDAVNRVEYRGVWVALVTRRIAQIETAARFCRRDRVGILGSLDGDKTPGPAVTTWLGSVEDAGSFVVRDSVDRGNASFFSKIFRCSPICDVELSLHGWGQGPFVRSACSCYSGSVSFQNSAIFSRAEWKPEITRSWVTSLWRE